MRYETAWRWFRDGKIQGQRIGPHTILMTEGQVAPDVRPSGRIVMYARVSSAENKPNLESQAERLVAYCAAKGYPINKIVKEIGSGVNDARPKRLALLEEQTITLIVVEDKDRLTRFGFRYLATLLNSQGRAIEVVNLADNGHEDLIADLTAILNSFTARLYGQWRAKRKTETIIRSLKAGEREDQDATGRTASD